MTSYRKSLNAPLTPVQYPAPTENESVRQIPLSGLIIQDATVIRDRNATGGLASPRNIGPCHLVIIPLNVAGRPISGREMILSPGERRPFFDAPPGTTKIIALPMMGPDGSPCPGHRTTLEYEIPAS